MCLFVRETSEKTFSEAGNLFQQLFYFGYMHKNRIRKDKTYSSFLSECFRLYCDGVIWVVFLNTELKVDKELKPES